MIKPKRTLILCLFMLLYAWAAVAQQKVVVTGIVVDEESIPVVGAVMTVPGNPALGGATTGPDGRFRFEVPVGSTVQVSMMGFVPWEQKITGPAVDLFISLQPDTERLEDAVVVAYGTQKKESIVGSISQVKSEELTNSGASQLTNALAAKVAGMNHYSTYGSGAPGEDNASFTIRGLSSWNGDSPLVMVDGVERSLTWIQPNDVESISVLKDASATAVYGAKGANGVILVTTKTGMKGRPKFHVGVQYGVEQPWRLPEHVDALTISEMANTAFRNAASFGTMYSTEELRKYADGSDPLRYPDVDWYKETLKDFATAYDVEMTITGGSDKVKYYFGGNYTHRGSIVKGLYEPVSSAYTNEPFALDNYNYRFNLDFTPTKTTTISLKLGGTLRDTRNLANGTSDQIFGYIYQVPTTLYPAYYPAWALEKYPDPDYPDEHDIRLASNMGAWYENPYSRLAHPNYKITERSIFTNDVHLKQKLDFITKGLSVTGVVSLMTTFNRTKQNVNASKQVWNIMWDLVDSGASNPWYTTTASNYVYNDKPYSISQTATASGLEYTFYLEGALRYNRKFANAHNVSALALYSQREFDSGASFPHRNQSLVGRVTYDYKGKYLFEGNVGYTGSEQFAPAYRYGLFPSVAVGWRISDEPFFKKAMPWWSTFKIRYSIGKVGNDNSSANWLYYRYWSRETRQNKFFVEGSAANENARWETALKQDLGIELGWLKDDLTLNIDFFNEHRYDMLVTPVVTAFVAIPFKDINAGELKKHGVDIELRYHHSWQSRWHLQTSFLAGWNENRILAYEEPAYTPQYQKMVGTLYGAARTGTSMVDDKYFTTVDEIHGYPTYTTTWLGNVVPGVLKYVDFKPDGLIDMSDAHTIKGSNHPPFTWSYSIGGGYKGFSVNAVFNGVLGKYQAMRRASSVPFLLAENVIHAPYINYWSPTNRNPDAPVGLYSDMQYSWAGGTAVYPGYDIEIEGYNWRSSDYLRLKELMFSYRFTSDGMLKKTGIDGLTVTLTGTDLFTITSLPELEPTATKVTTFYYPLMRVVKLGVKLDF